MGFSLFELKEIYVNEVRDVVDSFDITKKRLYEDTLISRFAGESEIFRSAFVKTGS